MPDRPTDEQLTRWAQGADDTRLMTVAAEVLELRQLLATAERERDLAIAHDRQPYPTAWAYEQACKALWSHRNRANAAEARVAALAPREIIDPAELDALPVGSIIVTAGGLARQKVHGWQEDIGWRWMSAGGMSLRDSAYVLNVAGPSVILVWVPIPAGEGDSPSTGDLGGKEGGPDSSAPATVVRPDAKNPTPALIEAAYIAQDDLSKPPPQWAIEAAAEIIDGYIDGQGHTEVHVLGHPKDWTPGGEQR